MGIWSKSLSLFLLVFVGMSCLPIASAGWVENSAGSGNYTLEGSPATDMLQASGGSTIYLPADRAVVIAPGSIETAVEILTPGYAVTHAGAMEYGVHCNPDSMVKNTVSAYHIMAGPTTFNLTGTIHVDDTTPSSTNFYCGWNTTGINAYNSDDGTCYDVTFTQFSENASIVVDRLSKGYVSHALGIHAKSVTFENNGQPVELAGKIIVNAGSLEKSIRAYGIIAPDIEDANITIGDISGSIEVTAGGYAGCISGHRQVTIGEISGNVEVMGQGVSAICGENGLNIEAVSGTVSAYDPESNSAEALRTNGGDMRVGTISGIVSARKDDGVGTLAAICAGGGKLTGLDGSSPVVITQDGFVKALNYGAGAIAINATEGLSLDIAGTVYANVAGGGWAANYAVQGYTSSECDVTLRGGAMVTGDIDLCGGDNTLHVTGGGTATVAGNILATPWPGVNDSTLTVAIDEGSTLAVALELNSSLFFAGTAHITNNGTLALAPGSGMSSGSQAFLPTSAEIGGSGIILCYGGRYNTETGVFTAGNLSQYTAGTFEDPIQVVAGDRLEFTDGGECVVMNFLDDESSVNAQVVSVSSCDSIDIQLLQTLAGYEVLTAWQFDVTLGDGDRVLLSFDVGEWDDETLETLIVWHDDGAGWTQMSPDDFSVCDGLVSFSVDHFSSYAITGGDVVEVPEPATIVLLLMCGLALALRRLV